LMPLPPACLKYPRYFSFIFYFQRFPVVPLAVTHFAWDIHVREEMHFDFDNSVSLASFAAAAFHVKAEAALFIAAHFRLIRLAKNITNIIENTDVRCRIGPWRPADRGLINLNHFVQMFQSFYFPEFPGTEFAIVQLSGNGFINYFIHKGTL